VTSSAATACASNTSDTQPSICIDGRQIAISSAAPRSRRPPMPPHRRSVITEPAVFVQSFLGGMDLL
jgi:hypothetical protein